MTPCPFCHGPKRETRTMCERCALRAIAAPGVGEHILNHVAECAVLLGLDVSELFRRCEHGRHTGYNRDPRNVLAREHLYYLAYSWLQSWGRPSWPEIAAACGMSNHSTVITAIRRVQARVMRDDLGTDGRLWAALNTERAAGHRIGEPPVASRRPGRGTAA